MNKLYYLNLNFKLLIIFKFSWQKQICSICVFSILLNNEFLGSSLINIVKIIKKITKEVGKHPICGIILIELVSEQTA